MFAWLVVAILVGCGPAWCDGADRGIVVLPVPTGPVRATILEVPIAPEVVAACTRGIVKVPVTWPPGAERKPVLQLEVSPEDELLKPLLPLFRLPDLDLRLDLRRREPRGPLLDAPLPEPELHLHYGR